MLIADEHLHVVYGFTAQGAHDGKLIARYRGPAVGIIRAVALRPFIGALHVQSAAHHFRALGVRQKQFALRAEDDDTGIHALENGFHELGLVAQFTDRFLELGQCPPVLGNVPKNRHAGLNVTLLVQQGPPAGADINPLRPFLVADEKLHVVHDFTAHGTHDDKLVGRNHCFPIRIIDTVQPAPVLRFFRHDAHAEHFFHPGIGPDPAVVRGGHEDGFVHALENGFHELRLVAQFLDGCFRLSLASFASVTSRKKTTPPSILSWPSLHKVRPVTLT